MNKFLQAIIRGYLPADFPDDEYESTSDNKKCNDNVMLNIKREIRNVRSELTDNSPKFCLNKMGFALVPGKHIQETTPNFQRLAFNDACEAVQGIMDQPHELFADSKFITIRNSRDGNVVPCLHSDYGVSLENFWRSLVVFTQLEHANKWLTGFARPEVCAYYDFNVWRILQPNYDDYMPLGMILKDSIDSKDIVFGRTRHPNSPDGRRNSFVRLRYSPRHDWCYVSGFKNDEMLIFKSFELSKDESAKFQPGCVHAAVDNSFRKFRIASRVSCEYRIGVFIFR